MSAGTRLWRRLRALTGNLLVRFVFIFVAGKNVVNENNLLVGSFLLAYVCSAVEKMWWSKRNFFMTTSNLSPLNLLLSGRFGFRFICLFTYWEIEPKKGWYSIIFFLNLLFSFAWLSRTPNRRWCTTDWSLIVAEGNGILRKTELPGLLNFFLFLWFSSRPNRR